MSNSGPHGPLVFLLNWSYEKTECLPNWYRNLVDIFKISLSYDIDTVLQLLFAITFFFYGYQVLLLWPKILGHKYHRYPVFSTRYSLMCKVNTGCQGTSEIEHGLRTCVVDYPLDKARGLSLRTVAQTTLKCLSIGTLKTIDIPYIPNGKLIFLGVPVFKLIIIGL